jgi:hypothetical protein
MRTFSPSTQPKFFRLCTNVSKCECGASLVATPFISTPTCRGRSDVCALAEDETKARPTSPRNWRRFIALPDVHSGNIASLFARSDQYIPAQACASPHFISQRNASHLTTERIPRRLARPAGAFTNTASAKYHAKDGTISRFAGSGAVGLTLCPHLARHQPRPPPPAAGAHFCPDLRTANGPTCQHAHLSAYVHLPTYFPGSSTSAIQSHMKCTPIVMLST